MGIKSGFDKLVRNTGVLRKLRKVLNTGSALIAVCPFLSEMLPRISGYAIYAMIIATVLLCLFTAFILYLNQDHRKNIGENEVLVVIKEYVAFLLSEMIFLFILGKIIRSGNSSNFYIKGPGIISCSVSFLYLCYSYYVQTFFRNVAEMLSYHEDDLNKTTDM